MFDTITIYKLILQKDRVYFAHEPPSRLQFQMMFLLQKVSKKGGTDRLTDTSKYTGQFSSVSDWLVSFWQDHAKFEFDKSTTITIVKLFSEEQFCF